MEKRDRTEEVLGCIVFTTRFVAILVAIGGGVKGVFTGEFTKAALAVGGAALFYGLVVVGTTLILKARKRREECSSKTSKSQKKNP